jgi:hypothetical protein
MYKGTFLAIAEVMGSHRSSQTTGYWQDAKDDWRDSEKLPGAAQSARPLPDTNHSRRYPWPLKAMGDRRCAE